MTYSIKATNFATINKYWSEIENSLRVEYKVPINNTKPISLRRASVDLPSLLDIGFDVQSEYDSFVSWWKEDTNNQNSVRDSLNEILGTKHFHFSFTNNSQGVQENHPAIRNIEAKPVTFRSQLEYHWALSWAWSHIKFKYEPRYYGNWLPDFVINDSVFIEVKPTKEIADAESGKFLPAMKDISENGNACLLIVGPPDSCKVWIFDGVYNPPLLLLSEFRKNFNYESHIHQAVINMGGSFNEI